MLACFRSKLIARSAMLLGIYVATVHTASAQPGTTVQLNSSLGAGQSRVFTITNATGTIGGYAGTANGGVGNSGWSAVEYGNGSGANGFLQVNSTSGSMYTINFNPRTVAAPNNADPARRPANFNEFSSYTWTFWRPFSTYTQSGRTVGDPNDPTYVAVPDTFTIGGVDVQNLGSFPTLASINTELNSRITVNSSSFWNWTVDPTVPLGDRGTFSLAISSDRRSIDMVYTPVPEPATMLGVAAIGAGLIGGLRRLRRKEIAVA